MTNKMTMIIVAIACLVIGAAGGYLGTQFTKRPVVGMSNRPEGNRGNFAGRPGQNGQFGNGGRVFGTVQSATDGRLTVSMPDGSSKIVLTNDGTTYQHLTTGSASDVTTGTQVVVTGQPNQDGSTTATAIQVVPAGMNLPFGNRGGQTSTQPNTTPQ